MTRSDPYAVTRYPHRDLSELTAITLTSQDGLAATFVPQAGMVGTSLTHHGEELLGLRDGLAAYVSHGQTFGIPLLAPWANRMVSRVFDGVECDTGSTPGVHLDGNGLPIHGLMAGCDAWRIVSTQVEPTAAVAVAALTFDSTVPGFPAFPFEHELRVELRLSESTLTISTQISATGIRPVPVCFGWHPYFAPPGADRSRWRLHSPFTQELVLDNRCCPTGSITVVEPRTVTLGDPAAGGVTLDNLFSDVAAGATAWIEGGRHRISLRYDSGYPYGVLFAPPDQDLVALEPMTAPTDPLAGHFPIRVVEPGQSQSATFSIVVTDAGQSA